jgi:hypothetical protein
LVAVVDADTASVQERIRQFDEALEAQKILPLQDQDCVARLVPKHNVETWLLCLNGVAVNEVLDYKGTRKDFDKLIREAAGSLYAWTRNNAQLPQYHIPSLANGVAELQKLGL